MVIERERAGGGEARLLGISMHTHTHAQRNTLKRWKEYREKLLAWVEWKKKFLLLTSSPSHYEK